MNNRLVPWVAGFLIGAMAVYLYMVRHGSALNLNTPLAPQTVHPVYVPDSVQRDIESTPAVEHTTTESNRATGSEGPSAREVSLRYGEYERTIREQRAAYKDLEKKFTQAQADLTEARGSAESLRGQYKEALSRLTSAQEISVASQKQYATLQQSQPTATITQAVRCVDPAPTLPVLSTDREESSTLKSVRWRNTNQGIVFMLVGNAETDPAVAKEREMVLREVAESVAATPQVTVTVKPRAVSSSNDELQRAQQRAEKVRLQLIAMGLAPGRVGIAKPTVVKPVYRFGGGVTDTSTEIVVSPDRPLPERPLRIEVAAPPERP